MAITVAAPARETSSGSCPGIGHQRDKPTQPQRRKGRTRSSTKNDPDHQQKYAYLAAAFS
jgi:hypothetical protein